MCCKKHGLPEINIRDRKIRRFQRESNVYNVHYRKNRYIAFPIKNEILFYEFQKFSGPL